MRDYLNEFQVCNTCYKQQIVAFLPSGNKVIDDFIRYTINSRKRVGKMEFVPYFKFKDVEFVAEGAFSKIYKATWIDGQISNYIQVALKELNNSEKINSKELNEVSILSNFYNFNIRQIA